MNLPLSPGAAKALALLLAAGYEAWIVGGCVRDALLGLPPKDYDLTTSALPEETQRVFAAYPRIETGLRHGTVTVLLEGEPLEITTYRVDGAYSDARHPDGVTFTRSLRQDAARRDFTINAMAYAPGQGLQDFFGGQADLAQGTIRAVGRAETRFHEDALRILRALRFASVLDFTLEAETHQAALACAPLLAAISPERVFSELGKLLCGKAAGRVLRTYPQVLGAVVPEILPMVGFDQRNAHHCYDVWTHTAVAVDHVPPELPLRLAMLFHDIGKPDTFSLGEDGQGHFYGHARRSVEQAEAILTRLRAPRQVRETVLLLVRYHDAVLEESPSGSAAGCTNWGRIASLTCWPYSGGMPPAWLRQIAQGWRGSSGWKSWPGRSFPRPPASPYGTWRWGERTFWPWDTGGPPSAGPSAPCWTRCCRRRFPMKKMLSCNG